MEGSFSGLIYSQSAGRSWLVASPVLERRRAANANAISHNKAPQETPIIKLTAIMLRRVQYRQMQTLATIIPVTAAVPAHSSPS